jgi:hypothetical protein
MQMVTVAIADTDSGRREKLEQSLQREQDITVLTNVMSEMSGKRRLKLHTDITEIEDVIARIGRLKPRILLVNVDESRGGNRFIGGFASRVSRHARGFIDR